MEGRETVNSVIKNLNESSNKEILYSLEYLSQDFEQTKNTIVKLTYHLDSTEQLYNKILKEYEKRTNVKPIIK
jgi:oligoribonuclease NrnB/cAMP/cGMP phosphodiesterase (DHH superfamily)